MLIDVYHNVFFYGDKNVIESHFAYNHKPDFLHVTVNINVNRSSFLYRKKLKYSIQN